MCCNECGKLPGFLGRQRAYLQGKRELARAEQQATEQLVRKLLDRKPGRTPTQKAQTVLAVVGGIVLLASMNAILHILAYTLAAVLCVLVISATMLAVRRRRQRRAVLPVPSLTSAPRTMVTGVTVRAIEPGARVAGRAPERKAARHGRP